MSCIIGSSAKSVGEAVLPMSLDAVMFLVSVHLRLLLVPAAELERGCLMWAGVSHASCSRVRKGEPSGLWRKECIVRRCVCEDCRHTLGAGWRVVDGWWMQLRKDAVTGFQLLSNPPNKSCELRKGWCGLCCSQREEGWVLGILQCKRVPQVVLGSGARRLSAVSVSLGSRHG